MYRATFGTTEPAISFSAREPLLAAGVISTGEISLEVTPPVKSIGGMWGIGNTLVATDQGGSMVFTVDTVTKAVATLAGFPNQAPSPDEDIRPLSGAVALWRQGQFFYVADPKHSVIHKVAADTGAVSTLVSGIRTPAGIWGDTDFLYVTQSEDGIVSRISLRTGEHSPFSTAFAYPTAITGDATYLCVTAQDYIIRISKTDGAVKPFARDLSVYGFRGITALWTDGARMFVLDSFGGVRRIDLPTLDITTIASPSIIGYGASSLWSDGNFRLSRRERRDPAHRSRNQSSTDPGRISVGVRVSGWPAGDDADRLSQRTLD
jgi:DNA-binding beta-propeller fold protein YncE